MKFNEDMFSGKMSNLVDVCDHSHCVLDTRKNDQERIIIGILENKGRTIIQDTSNIKSKAKTNGISRPD